MDAVSTKTVRTRHDDYWIGSLTARTREACSLTFHLPACFLPKKYLIIGCARSSRVLRDNEREVSLLLIRTCATFPRSENKRNWFQRPNSTERSFRLRISIQFAPCRCLPKPVSVHFFACNKPTMYLYVGEKKNTCKDRRRKSKRTGARQHAQGNSNKKRRKRMFQPNVGIYLPDKYKYLNQVLDACK